MTEQWIKSQVFGSTVREDLSKGLTESHDTGNEDWKTFRGEKIPVTLGKKQVMESSILWAGLLKTEARNQQTLELKKAVQEANLEAEKEEEKKIADPLKCDLISDMGKTKTSVSAQHNSEMIDCQERENQLIACLQRQCRYLCSCMSSTC